MSELTRSEQHLYSALMEHGEITVTYEWLIANGHHTPMDDIKRIASFLGAKIEPVGPQPLGMAYSWKLTRERSQ